MKKAGWIALIISAVLVVIAGTAAAGQEISPRAFRDDETDMVNGDFRLRIENADRIKDGLMTDIWQYNYPEGPEE